MVFATVREMLGIKQDVLEKIAKILKVPAEAIKNFNKDAAVNIIAGTINQRS